MNHLDAVLDAVACGYPVFPCVPRGKRPLTPHGFKEATRDERTIVHWDERWPDANWATSGGAGAFNVLDLDPKGGADPEEILETLPVKRVVAVWTGLAPERSREFPRSLVNRRGMHLHFAGRCRSGMVEIGGKRHELRSDGTYVLIPPSVHPSGARYEWASGHPPQVAALPPLPSELEPRRRVRGESAKILDVSERHDGLVAIAIDLLHRGVREADLLRGALLEANRVRCRPPKPEDEVAAIATWAAEEAGISNGACGGFAERWAETHAGGWG